MYVLLHINKLASFFVRASLFELCYYESLLLYLVKLGAWEDRVSGLARLGIDQMLNQSVCPKVIPPCKAAWWPGPLASSTILVSVLTCFQTSTAFNILPWANILWSSHRLLSANTLQGIMTAGSEWEFMKWDMARCLKREGFRRGRGGVNLRQEEADNKGVVNSTCFTSL